MAIDGALAGEALRRTEPDAARGSGDDCDATVKATHGDSSFVELDGPTLSHP